MKSVNIFIGLVVLWSNSLWAERFELLSSDRVYDNETELLWSSSSSDKPLTYEKSVSYCKRYKLRVPLQYELKSLVDYKAYNPAIGTNLIHIQKDESYWSSSSYYFDDKNWMVYFVNGKDLHAQKRKKHYVLCVE